MVKNLPTVWETLVQSLGQEDPLEEGIKTHSSNSCLENPHGPRSLVGYSPWAHKQLDMTEQLSTAQHSTLFHSMASPNLNCFLLLKHLNF